MRIINRKDVMTTLHHPKDDERKTRKAIVKHLGAVILLLAVIFSVSPPVKAASQLIYTSKGLETRGTVTETYYSYKTAGTQYETKSFNTVLGPFKFESITPMYEPESGFPEFDIDESAQSRGYLLAPGHPAGWSSKTATTVPATKGETLKTVEMYTK